MRKKVNNIIILALLLMLGFCANNFAAEQVIEAEGTNTTVYSTYSPSKKPETALVDVSRDWALLSAKLKAAEQVSPEVVLKLKEIPWMVKGRLPQDEIGRIAIWIVYENLVLEKIVNEEVVLNDGIMELKLKARFLVDSGGLQKEIESWRQSDRREIQKAVQADVIARIKKNVKDEIASLKRTSQAMDKRIAANEWYIKGGLAKDYDSAIEALSKAVEIDPTYANAYFDRGWNYYNRGNIDLAIVDYSKAIELEPQNAKAYINRAISYKAKGQVDLAIADYSQAIRLDPTDADAYYNRAISYKAKGQVDLAIADYSKAIELDSTYASSYYNRGISYAKKGQYDLAIADYSKAIELDSTHASSYYNRGVSYTKKGQHDLAIADYSKAIELEPTNANAYNNRGFSYEMKGQYALALADYNKALELSPQDEVVKNNRYLLLQELNKS